MPDVTAARSDPPVPNGEFPFTWSDFQKIASLVHGEAGIVLTENKVNLVYSRLAKRLRAIGLRNFRDYCALVESAEGTDERQALIAAMTTNVTRFFREQHHFDHLTAMALPRLIATARAGGRVRIWSSACSSGEEPYSIALTVLQAMPDAREHDVLILASDIDPDILERAKSGVYPIARLDDIPQAMRGSWIQTAPGTREFSFRPEVKSLIRFRQLNLLHDWPIRNTFDVIFCRNVMIYFDQNTQDDIWRRFAARMSGDSYLYIGHSERIATDRLPFSLAGQTVYKHTGAL